MSRLPRISGRECIRALAKVGFRVMRQEGSHVVLRRTEPFAQLTVPNHRELGKGILRAIIRQAGLTVDDFLRLL